MLNQYVILRYCSSNLCKWKYLYGDLPFFKIQVNHFMAQGESFGAKIIPKCILRVRSLVPFWVWRHSFLSLTDCWWPYNIQLKTSRGVLCLPPSDAYVRSFLYLLYTLIKLYYTKALSDQASSLAPHWILLLWGPRILASWFNNNLSSWGLVWDPSGQAVKVPGIDLQVHHTRDGPDNLCELTSADSRHPESAVWSSRQWLPVPASLLRCIPQSV